MSGFLLAGSASRPLVAQGVVVSRSSGVRRDAVFLGMVGWVRKGVGFRGPMQLGWLRYALLLFGVLCQCVTISITWPLWQVRDMPPHLPTLDVPQLPFGWALIATLVLTVWRPRVGVAVHFGVLVVAAVIDQFRLQPQFFSIAVLMAACVWDAGHRIARWSLVSTWVWAGLHKLLSPDWFGYASHWLVARSGFDADENYWWVALVVAIVELTVGVIAIGWPRLVAPACCFMHLGIAFTISPLLVDWNESVLPWNLSVAVIGTWVMWTTKSWRPEFGWEWLVFSFACFAPAGFFVGWLDHGFSGVLYSGSIPQGLVTTRSGVLQVDGWGDLRVPFPKERRTIRIYFEQVGQPGDKLHLSDPRPLLDDAFYVLGGNGKARPISRDEFFAGVPVVNDGLAGFDGAAEMAGVAVDSRRALFELRRAGVKLLRAAEVQPIFAVEFSPDNFEPGLLEHLVRLPNVMQVQLAGTAVRDEDLVRLAELRLLTGVGLSHTAVTDSGIENLSGLPYLQVIECEGTEITEAAIAAVINPVPSFAEEMD
ncbi:hypothetical protein LOC70_22345 [Rhodopirellula sp. JC737]|nr:hypothetical protein [Rhodopirellula sp. JC737]